ncbi:MAG: hypothetical protein RLZZ361_1231, partial [Cyanobacteriota bacterium]
MKLKYLALLFLIISSLRAGMAVPVGNNLELVPAPRNLGINIDLASQKLTVNGAIALTNLSNNPLTINSQPSVFVRNNELFYSSILHSTPFRLDTNSSNGALLSNPIFSGNVNFGTSVLSPLRVSGAISASLFNGGIFRGDGSQLFNIPISSINTNIGKIENVRVNGAVTASIFNGGIFKGDGSRLTDIFINTLADAKTDNSSIFLGKDSGSFDNGGNFNLGLGINSLKNISSGSKNIAIGYSSSNGLTTGSNNLSIGFNNLKSGSDLNNIIAIGNNTAPQIDKASSSIFFGNNINVITAPTNYDIDNSGVLDANDPTVIMSYLNSQPNPPFLAKYDINSDGSVTSLDALVIVNFLNSNPNLNDTSNQIFIGNQLLAPRKSNFLNLGNILFANNISNNGSVSSGNVGIGIQDPRSKLDVSGDIRALNFIGNGRQLSGISGASITGLALDNLVDVQSSRSS